jgi:hypothetical protein
MKFEPGNKEHKKKYDSPEQLQTAVDAYFEKMDNEDRPYTVQGLCVALGFSSMQTLINYGTLPDYEPFHESVRMAKLKIEAYKAEGLQDRGKSTIGIIFDLKNNFNWADKHEIEQTVTNGTDIDLSKLSPELLKQILSNQKDEDKQ